LLTGVITATVEDRHRSAEFIAFRLKYKMVKDETEAEASVD